LQTDTIHKKETTMTYLLALDQGTSSSRSIVFDETGRTVAMAQLELRQIYPQPGWVEHDAAGDLAHPARHRARRPGQGRPARPAQVKAVGITNQRETTVAWNRTHRRADTPRHRLAGPARRAHLCATCARAGSPTPIQTKTGLLVDAVLLGTKLKWLLDHVPGARAAGRQRRAGLRHRRQLAASGN